VLAWDCGAGGGKIVDKLTVHIKSISVSTRSSTIISNMIHIYSKPVLRIRIRIRIGSGFNQVCGSGSGFGSGSGSKGMKNTKNKEKIIFFTLNL